jgi:hypothetical protein
MGAKMGKTQRTLWSCLIFLLGISGNAGAATEDKKDRYEGPDAGYAVLSILVVGEAWQGNLYQLMIRKADQSMATLVTHYYKNMFVSTNDMKDIGLHGHLSVKKLAPGDYEVFSYRVSWPSSQYLAGGEVYPTEPFSIPFKVEAGKTTYVGCFGAVQLYGKNFMGLKLPAGARFIVTDQSERDIPIARTKEPELGPVVLQVPDIDALNIPLFSSTLH